jgi:hypothetical protein
MMSATSVRVAASFFTRLSHIHSQWPIPEDQTIEHYDGFLRLCLIAHFHECEAFGATTLSVLN